MVEWHDNYCFPNKILHTRGIVSIPHNIVKDLNNVMKKPCVKTFEWWVASLAMAWYMQVKKNGYTWYGQWPIETY
jgi:hypothetical protein